jgi:hypothetical protein
MFDKRRAKPFDADEKPTSMAGIGVGAEPNGETMPALMKRIAICEDATVASSVYETSAWLAPMLPENPTAATSLWLFALSATELNTATGFAQLPPTTFAISAMS